MQVLNLLHAARWKFSTQKITKNSPSGHYRTTLHSSSRRQPKFAALNRGRHIYSAGRPSHCALAHILVFGVLPARRCVTRCPSGCQSSRVLSKRLGGSSWFWATVPLCYQTVFCLSCPVCMSVCNVGVLWSNGWMDQDET